MSRKPQSISVDGEFWFAIGYTAKLLHTSRSKLEMLVLRGDLRSREDKAGIWIAEEAVTKLRRDETARKKLLQSVRIERAPKRPDIGGGGPPIGSKAREDQHVLPISDHRLPLRRR